MDPHSNLIELFISILIFFKIYSVETYLKYKNVLVSCRINTCIYEAQVESRFRSCNGDSEKFTLGYVTKDTYQVTVPCFCEISSTAAVRVTVAKVTVVAGRTTDFVKGKSERFQKTKVELFLHHLEDVDHLML